MDTHPFGDDTNAASRDPRTRSPSGARTPSRAARAATGLALVLGGAGLAAFALEGFTSHAGAQAVARAERDAGSPVSSAARATSDQRPVLAPSGPRASYADVLEPAMRAVVQIRASSTARERDGARETQRGLPFPWPFPGPMPDEPDDFDSNSLGSGVIVRPDGVILTNNHVVEGADDVRVMLADRRELRARVVGTDPATDIAVLRVDQQDLPYLRIGSSADLRVGDVVFAIGSPFELTQSATMGIVSATGRSNLGITRMQDERGYENFIQTDAAINRGNSGGPLLDSRGEVVGINTAIYGGVTGNVGIGFAVPADLARGVMDQLLTEGRVVRSQLGVLIKPVDMVLARSYGLDRPDGALVTHVMEGSPAEEAGLRVGDLLVELDGRLVVSDSQLRLDISNRRPGSKIELVVIGDDGRRRTVAATLRERTTADAGEDVGADGDDVPRTGSVDDANNALRGIEVAELSELSPQQRERLRLAGDAQGVVVTRVERGSPAARAGLVPFVVIQQIAREPVRRVADFRRLASEHGRELVRLRVLRGENVDIVALEP